jgi:hypothetical protein
MPNLAAEPGSGALAAEARRMIEMHNGDWDSLHAFATLHWDGAKFTVGTWCAIDTSFAPGDYAAIMEKAAFERLREEPENPPYAYALQVEAHVSTLPPGASAQERAQMSADLRAEKLHLRPGARECAEAWVADIHGRLWSARRFRGADGIEERHVPAHAPAPGPAVFTGPLISVARTTGTLAWGLEPTPAEQQVHDALRAFRKPGGKARG